MVLSDFAAEDVAEGREGVVHGLVVDGLVQVLDEDVADAGPAKAGVSLAPHDADGLALQHVEVHGVESALGCGRKKCFWTKRKVFLLSDAKPLVLVEL